MQKQRISESVIRRIGTPKPPKFPNGLTMGYRAIHGCDPPILQQGLTASPKKTWREIKNIDGNLKDKWLEDLNSIEGVEILSTEEGENAYRPAHVVFGFVDSKDDCKAEGICDFLNHVEGSVRFFSYCDKGNKGRVRIVIAGEVLSLTWEWNHWWSNISYIIFWALVGLGSIKRKGMK